MTNNDNKALATFAVAALKVMLQSMVPPRSKNNNENNNNNNKQQ